MRRGLYRKTPNTTRAWKDRWPNFTPQEFSCKCQGRFCKGEYFHDPEFLDALQELRTRMGHALIINSGHRCSGWNRAVGGALRSQHLGIATDVSIHGLDHFKLLDNALELGFTGIGTGNTFLHIDHRAVPARWNYGPASVRKWTR